MADIIKNGSFENGPADSYGYNFSPTNWIVPTPAFCIKQSKACDTSEGNTASIVLSGTNWNYDDLSGSGIPDGIPSVSIQQCIDLTEYDKELVLDIEFYYGMPLNFGTREGRFNVFLYKVASYDSTANTYTYEGSYFDCLTSDTFSIYSESTNDMCWTRANFIATNVEPGLYVLVFAAPIANPQTSNYFAIDKVSGEVKETGQKVIPYHNIIKNGSFEVNNGEEFDNWHYNEITVMPDSVDSYGSNMSNAFGSYVCWAKSDSLENAKNHIYGLKQVLEVDSYCKMDISLAYKQYADSPFALSLYKIIYSMDNDENAPEGSDVPWYVLEDTPYFQTTIEAENPSLEGYSNWEGFQHIVGVEPGEHLLVIHPGEKSTVIDNIKVNIFTEQKTDNDGSFEKPYTLEDGHFSPDGKLYFLYNATGEPVTGFIYNEDEYYYCIEEVLVLDEIHDNRYYFPDGTMARFESFTYNGEIYTSDMFGNIVSDDNYILEIIPHHEEQIAGGAIKELDVIVDNEVSFYASYSTQSSAVSLSVVSSNSSVAVCSGVTPGINKNIISLIGKSPGTSTITLSYINPDGSVTEKEVQIIVLPDELSYTDPQVMFLRRSIVCVLPGDEDKTRLDYTIIPKQSMAMAVSWKSSDESIATVDPDGYVTGHNLGSCKITAYNYRLDLSCTCDLYVIEKALYPEKVQRASLPISTIQTEQEVRLPDFSLCDYGKRPNTVIQDGYWTSNNPSIVSINEYGMFVGKSVGRTSIVFRTNQNPDLVSSFGIEVVKAEIAVKNIELDVYNATLSYPTPQGRFKIDYKLSPSNTTQTEVFWSSNKPDLVSVSSDGVVELLKEVKEKETVVITCTCASNQALFQKCIVTIDPDEKYPFVVKAFDTNFGTIVNRAVNIEYQIINCFQYTGAIAFSYALSIRHNGNTPIGSESKYSMEHEEGTLIRITPFSKGTYSIELGCRFIDKAVGENTPIYYGSKFFTVVTNEESDEPQFLEELEIVSELSNGSYILRFFVGDNADRSLSFEININNGWKPVVVSNCMYQGNIYNYIFGEKLSQGLYAVQVRVTNTTNNKSATSSTVMLIIPEITEDKKAALLEAKTSYESAENDIVSYLEDIVLDKMLYDNEELEFDTRYKIYCQNYSNLKNMLEICVSHINEQIAISEGTMITLSNTLSSNGVSVASYPEDIHTNSNYQNVSDMDYYQNECIKQLVARVLELEARLNDLTNK